MIIRKPVTILGKTLLLISLTLLGLGLFAVASRNFARYQQAAEERRASIIASPRDATYTVDGAAIALTDGVAALPDGLLSLFGTPVEGDLNGDGVNDAAVLLVMDGGGSGTFYYVAAALKHGESYEGTNAILLGDRIAPNTTNIRGGIIIHDYATRAPGEPMTTPPSVGASIYLRYVDGLLVETADRPQP